MEEQVSFCFMGHTYVVLEAPSCGPWKATELLSQVAGQVAVSEPKTNQPLRIEA